MTILLRRLILLWALALTPLLFWTASLDMFEQPKQLALKTAAPLLSLIMVPGTLPPALSSILVLFLLLGLASSVLSPLPLYSLFGEYSSYQGWLHWAALAAILSAAVFHLRKPGEPRRLLSAVSASAGLVSGYALVQLAGMDPVAWSNGGSVFRAFSTAGNPLYLGFLLSALVPASLGLALTSRTRAGRNAWLGMALLVFLGTLSSGSRSAAAGSLIGSLLLAWKSPDRVTAGFPFRVFGGLALAVLVAASALLPADRNPVTVLATRLSQMVQEGDARPVIWAGAGRLVRSRPLLGHGPDTFATLHPGVQSPRLWNRLWHSSPEKAHNEFVQLAASAGIPAAGLAAWLGAWLLSLAWRFRHDPLCAASGAGLVAVSVPALFGFLTCGTQAVAILLAAILVSRTTPGRGLPPALWKCAGGLLAVSLAIHLQFATSQVALKGAARSGGAGMDRALALRTPWAQDLLAAGDTLERGWFGPGLAVAQKNDPRLELLSRIYTRALWANPFHPFCHSAVGRLEFRAGNTAGAVDEYRKARLLAPWDVYLPMEEAQMLVSSRRQAEGIAVLEEAAKMYPRFGEPAGMIGYLWLAGKKPALAEPWLRKAVEGEWYGNNAAAYAAAVNLVVLYRKAGRWDESTWAEAAAARYAPGNPPRP
jgi:O-antigen ligase